MERFFTQTARKVCTVGCCRELEEGGWRALGRLSRVRKLPQAQLLGHLPEHRSRRGHETAVEAIAGQHARDALHDTLSVHLQAIEDRFHLLRDRRLPFTHRSAHAIDQHQVLAEGKSFFDPLAVSVGALKGASSERF